MTALYQYQGCIVKRVADGVLITSADPLNSDLMAYQAWAAIPGNVPDPDPAIVAPIPDITTRQFLIQAAAQGLITAEEAVAAAETNAIPATIQAVFESLPSEQQIAARITWAKMTIIGREEPLVVLAAAAFNLNGAQTDQFFRDAGAV